MRESIIQTAINKFLYWLAKRSVTALYKRTRFWTCSWGVDDNTDLYLMSEESYPDYHRFGLREEKYADIPQKDCYDYSKSEMENIKCGNGITTEIPQTDCESCEHKHDMGLPCYHCPIAVDCGWGEPK